MPEENLDQTLLALADPTRRRVIELLRRKPQRAGDLATALSMSSPRLSRHLRVLRRSGLIEDSGVEHDARVSLYRLRPERFAILRTWLEDVEAFWTAELDAFKAHAERTRRSSDDDPAPSKLAPPGDQVTVSVLVAVEPRVVRSVHAETDLWWKRGLRYRVAGERPGTLQFEGGVGGRLFETFETASGVHVFENGRITAWEPPSRLMFEWRNSNCAPGESTEVEVLFEPAAAGTLVTIQHRGWSSLRPDHPARHGLTGPAFSRSMGLWWSDQLTALREFTAT
jgi:DNA-binding transcriptional ArsR family regulator/uncharacterized protein YndB with AHSA1/START domain